MVIFDFTCMRDLEASITSLPSLRLAHAKIQSDLENDGRVETVAWTLEAA